MTVKLLQRDVYDNISPIDYRYWDKDVAHYLSENGFTRYKLLVELALVRTLHRRRICGDSVLRQVEKACSSVRTLEIYEEERATKHDIRALVNRIRARVSQKSKPFVHMVATSYDIVDTANAARFKDVTQKVLIPTLIALQKNLINLVIREAETLQIGRTHGQHAVPITFGFALAEYISRIGESIKALKALSEELVGKFSGAVGAYNASSLFVSDPEAFEAEILAEMGLKPAEHSTQIAPPEAMTRLLCEITIASGIMANLADDMRHLQRTEISEVYEPFEKTQVGSSTMAQKKNPINLENCKSMWKIIMPRIITVFLDQISEHQRDLTNSASSRTYGETVAYTVAVAKRLSGVIKDLEVDHENISRNFDLQKGLVVAEPAYLILAALGHPDAHEKIRVLSMQARKEHKPLERVMSADEELTRYIIAMSPGQKEILNNPRLYVGISASKAVAVATRWQSEFAA